MNILCNNAGVDGGGLVKNQQLVDWKWVIDVSLWGVIHGLHHFLPHLLEAEESHVMSTASVAGLMAVPGTLYEVGVWQSWKPCTMKWLAMVVRTWSRFCPSVVRTNIATAQRNRPDHLRRQRGELGSVSARPKGPFKKRCYRRSTQRYGHRRSRQQSSQRHV